MRWDRRDSSRPKRRANTGGLVLAGTRQDWRCRILSSAPILNGGDPCTPPSSLRSARSSPLAPLRSRLNGGDPCTPPSSLRSARSSPLAPLRSRLNGGDPCTPPSSLRSARSSPLAPLRSRRSRVPNEFVSNGWQAKRRLSSVLSAVAQGAKAEASAEVDLLRRYR